MDHVLQGAGIRQIGEGAGLCLSVRCEDDGEALSHGQRATFRGGDDALSGQRNHRHLRTRGVGPVGNDQGVSRVDWRNGAARSHDDNRGLRETLCAGEQNERTGIERKLDLRQRVAAGIDSSCVDGFTDDQFGGGLQLDEEVIGQAKNGASITSNHNHGASRQHFVDFGRAIDRNIVDVYHDATLGRGKHRVGRGLGGYRCPKHGNQSR